MSYIEKQYARFIDKHKHFPIIFEPYNCRELDNIHPTLTANSYLSVGKAGGVLIVVRKSKDD